ncbi:hypothetical protein [Lysinibacillus endophyticus]|nr:hypothetical protein [Lysinibacillus endophyticus]MCP1143186.1 hypothetical protein [Lysinibacillus endophyticus]
MNYEVLNIFIGIIFIFLGNALLNITIDDQLTKNIMLKISGGLVVYSGIVLLVRALKKDSKHKRGV